MDHTKLYQADLDSLRQELFVCDLRFVLCVALLVCRNRNLFRGPLGVQPEERAWFRSGCHDDLYPVLDVILSYDYCRINLINLAESLIKAIKIHLSRTKSLLLSR